MKRCKIAKITRVQCTVLRLYSTVLPLTNFRVHQSEIMSDDEILELGADGTFEIPTAVPMQIKPKVDDVALDYSNVDVNLDDVDHIVNTDDMLLAIGQGSYKVIKSDKYIYIIVRLFSINESVVEVTYLRSEVTIQTTASKKYTIELKDIDLDAKSGACTSYDDLITIRYVSL